MGYHRPRILSRAESAELAARQRELRQEAMTPADIGNLMRRAVNDALDRKGSVEPQDFRRFNVPETAIATRGRAIIMEVVQERADGGICA